MSSIAAAPAEDIAAVIKPCGLTASKTASVKDFADRYVNEWGGSVPNDVDELMKVKGIGRKIANLIVGEIYGTPAIVVDTHCKRVMKRVGITESEDPARVEKDMMKVFEEDDIKVLHTPFHTKGSVCYYFINNKWLFSGDTLFKNSIGRDDLPNAIPSKTYESLRKIKALHKDTKIYPGHGPNTVLESELMLNHFLIN